MTEIVSFTLGGRNYCIRENDVSGWKLIYCDTGIVLILFGYTVTEGTHSISDVHIGDKCFSDTSAVVTSVGNNTKIIIVRSQFKP